MWSLETIAAPLLLCTALVGILGGLRLSRWTARRRLRRARRRGIAAEETAVAMLEQAGYQVLAAQVERRYRIGVDGEDREAIVRADLIVARRGRTSVVEVKTGSGADPLAVATRRQLLEYRHAFPEVDSLVLADMEGGRLLQVSFGDEARIQKSRVVLLAAIALVAVALVASALLIAY